MASVKKLMAAGLSSLSANSAAGQISPELTATGSTQGTALLLNSDINIFGTVALNTGAILNPDYESCFIFNGGAATLSLYPPDGGSIDGGTTNSAVSIVSGAKVLVFRGNTSAPDYVTLKGA